MNKDQLLRLVKCVFVFYALHFVLTMPLYGAFYLTILKLNLDVFTETGELIPLLRDPWPLGVATLALAGYLTFLLERKQLLAEGKRNGRKIVFVSFVLVFMFMGLPHGLSQQVEHSPLRAKKLVQTHGVKADPCAALSLGMTKEEAMKVMGPEQMKPYEYVEKGKSYYSLDFKPITGPYRPVTFEAETNRIVKIRCFDGSSKR